MALGPHTAVIFGLLGNIVSFLVFLSPLPTFYRIFKKKSTEGFQSIPYSVSLFSAMLLLYYGFLKVNGFLLITINSIGCVIQTFYLIVYMIYATKSSKVYTARLIILFNIGALGVIVFFTYMFSKGFGRISVVGWISAVFSVLVFAAPLSIIRKVIKTKSVEYMPFPLSFCLTVCAVMWLLYGLSINDYYVAAPNFLGLAFGVTQMILYLVYRKRRNEVLPTADPKAKANGTHMIGTALNREVNSDGVNSGEVEIKSIEPHEENV